MPGTPSLPDELVALLAEMYGEANPATNRRWDQRSLAAFCALPPWSITTCHTTVGRAIKPLRDLRAALTQDLLRERIATTLPAQIETLDNLITRVAAHAAHASPMVQRKGLDSVVKALNVKLRYSGVAASLDLSGTMDITSDGQRMAFYVPIKHFDDGGSPDADDPGAGAGAGAGPPPVATE